MPSPIRISVAELAFAMSQSGNVEAAFSYLQTVLTDLTPERFSDWITAASHALIARDLLSTKPDGSYGELDTNLNAAAQAIIRDTRTLRCHWTRNTPEGTMTQLVSLLFDERLILAHWLEQRIVAVLETIPTRAEAYAYIASFAGAQVDNVHAAKSYNPQQIPMSELGNLRQAARLSSHQEMLSLLSQYINASWLADFAATLIHPDALWGDVLRIERIGDEVTAERGFLFVSSENTAWLLGVQGPDESQLSVMPTTRQLISEWCEKILT